MADGYSHIAPLQVLISEDLHNLVNCERCESSVSKGTVECVRPSPGACWRGPIAESGRRGRVEDEKNAAGLNERIGSVEETGV